jgi:hypothetical protein
MATSEFPISTPKGSNGSLQKFLLGTVVIGALMSAANYGVSVVRDTSAEALRKVTAVERDVAVLNSQREEVARWRGEMREEMRGVNEKLDRLLRRSDRERARDGQ